MSEGKAATLRDVAERAGASLSAASVALNGAGKTTIRVSVATRERIAAAAAELGYVTNPIARSLATGRTGVLGFMLPQSSSFTEHDPFLTLVTNGVVAEAVRQRYNVMLYTATGEREGAGAAVMVDSRVDGVLLVIPPEDTPLLAECRAKGIAVVSLLRRAEGPGEWTVNADDYEGGRLATQHLVDLGHRRLAHVVGDPAIVTTAARRQAFLDTLAANGLAHDPRRLVPGGFSASAGQAAGERLLALPADARPSAVVCANDLVAHGVLLAAAESGLRVPEDLAVVGYDDTWFSSMTQPPLTTVNMAIESLGALATRLLVAQIEGKPVPDRQPVLPVSLTIRRSTAAPPSSRNLMQRSKAFTLIELLVVIAIIAILAAILFPVFAQAKAAAKNAAALSNIKQIGTGLAIYTNDADDAYPLVSTSDWNAGFPLTPWSSAVVTGPYIKNGGIWASPGDTLPKPMISAPTPARVPYPMSLMPNALVDDTSGAGPWGVPGGHGPFGFGDTYYKGVNHSSTTTESSGPADTILLIDGRKEYVGDYWGCPWSLTTEGDWCYDSYYNETALPYTWVIYTLAKAIPADGAAYKAWHKQGTGVNATFMDGHAKNVKPGDLYQAKRWLVNAP